MLTIEHLSELCASYRESLSAQVKEFSIGQKACRFNGDPVLMGVINLSADSWYRESVCLHTHQALRRADMLMAQGADLIDLGAESTLAHASRVEVDQQWKNLAPVLERIVHQGGCVSLETYAPEIVERALKAGVRVINLTGNSEAERIYALCAEYDAAVIICHVQGANVRQVGKLVFEGDPIDSMMAWFEGEIQKAELAGLKKMFLDPGLGFYYSNLKDGKERVRYQMSMFLNTFRLRRLGWPVCHALPHAFEFFGEEVRTAESFFAMMAILGKTDLIRTHEVAKVRAVIDTMSHF
jgi:dihydropteroate synthase